MFLCFYIHYLISYLSVLCVEMTFMLPVKWWTRDQNGRNGSMTIVISNLELAFGSQQWLLTFRQTVSAPLSTNLQSNPRFIFFKSLERCLCYGGDNIHVIVAVGLKCRRRVLLLLGVSR